ncbi:cupin domain-containing protein [Elusimicrobiota bacterium]
MDISIKKISQEELETQGILDWPVWEKEVSKFDWHYDSNETCYIISGRVVITSEGGNPVEIEPGDLVVFPKGMDCTWDIRENVRKHFSFA